MHEHPHGTRICAAEHLQFQMPRSELIIIALGLSLRIYIYILRLNRLLQLNSKQLLLDHFALRCTCLVVALTGIVFVPASIVALGNLAFPFQ
jgi:hypothetical protein